jgi:RepB DNA-primase from phage plasmid
MFDDHKLLTDLWARQPGRFICLSTKGTDGWRDWFFDAVDLSEFVRENAHNNCYFAPMKFDARARRKEHAVLPRLLWADLDGADPNKLELEPTMAIESSPKRYAGFWLTDRVVTEDLNKRMTYYAGGDKGGWDLVQVLRLPGSCNHKYPGAPRARVLWDDGPRYRVSDLEKRLPLVTTRAAVVGERRVSRKGMQQIIDRYELSNQLKRDLLGKGRLMDGQRGYKVHWRMACALHEAGVPRDEAFVLLSETKWNKHTSDGPVWAMIDKIWS